MSCCCTSSSRVEVRYIYIRLHFQLQLPFQLFIENNLNIFDVNPRSCICLPSSNVMLKTMLILTHSINISLFHNKMNGNHLCFYQTIRWIKILVWKDNNIMNLSYNEIKILYVIILAINRLYRKIICYEFSVLYFYNVNISSSQIGYNYIILRFYTRSLPFKH